MKKSRLTLIRIISKDGKVLAEARLKVYASRRALNAINKVSEVSESVSLTQATRELLAHRVGRPAHPAYRVTSLEVLE